LGLEDSDEEEVCVILLELRLEDLVFYSLLSMWSVSDISRWRKAHEWRIRWVVDRMSGRRGSRAWSLFADI